MKRLPLITGIVVIIGAIATIVINVQSCRNRRAAAPSAPLSAAERTQARIAERMADPNYTNSLALLSDRQAQLVQLSHDAADEFKAWCAGFFASNEAARVLSENIYKLAGEGMTPTNADFAAKIAELESMIAADPQGKYLLDKRDKITEALAEHGRVAAAFVGERLRRQKASPAPRVTKGAPSPASAARAATVATGVTSHALVERPTRSASSTLSGRASGVVPEKIARPPRSM